MADKFRSPTTFSPKDTFSGCKQKYRRGRLVRFERGRNGIGDVGSVVSTLSARAPAGVTLATLARFLLHRKANPQDMAPYVDLLFYPWPLFISARTIGDTLENTPRLPLGLSAVQRTANRTYDTS